MAEPRRAVPAAPWTIATDDPLADDVRALLSRHLAFVNTLSPPQDVHALDVDALLAPAVTFVSLRENDALLGVGALKQLDATHGELKSMHSATQARGRGIGAAVLEHLLDLARSRGYARVSLETGTAPEFGAARRLYERAGFVPCEPFDDYAPSTYSAFFTLRMHRPPSAGVRRPADPG